MHLYRRLGDRGAGAVLRDEGDHVRPASLPRPAAEIHHRFFVRRPLRAVVHLIKLAIADLPVHRVLRECEILHERFEGLYARDVGPIGRPPIIDRLITRNSAARVSYLDACRAIIPGMQGFPIA